MATLLSYFPEYRTFTSKYGIKNVFHLPSFYNHANTHGATSVAFQTICPIIHMTYNIHFHYPKIGTISIGILFIIHVSIKFFLIFRKLIPILSPQETAWSHKNFSTPHTLHDILPMGNPNA